MACFLVPTGEAIVVSIIEHRVAKKDAEKSFGEIGQEKASGKISWKTKLSWLTSMLWGGAILLALEHIWHGEVVLYPPFLTAISDPADTAEMLHEMSTVGVSMAVLVTAIWVVMVLIADNVTSIKKAIDNKPKYSKEV